MTHYQEYTLFLPPNCPTKWDHLNSPIPSHLVGDNAAPFFVQSGLCFPGGWAHDVRTWTRFTKVLSRHHVNRLKRSQEMEELLTAASWGSGAKGCLQDWCGAVSVHRY